MNFEFQKMFSSLLPLFGLDSFQQNLAKYLLKQTIGRFLSDEVDWDQYDLKLVNGQVTLNNLQLDKQLINESLKQHGLAMASGTIETLRISVPWNGLFAEPCSMEIEGLELQLEQLAMDDVESPIFTVPSPILSSSFHFAGAFLQESIVVNEENDEFNSHDGQSAKSVADLATMIENVLGKAILSLSRATIRIASIESQRVLEVSLDQMSLSDHTSEAVSNMIPKWLWIQRDVQSDSVLSTVVKYLRILGIRMQVVSHSPQELQHIVSIPQGWLRILFQQDSVVSEDADLARSSFWMGDVDLACDLEFVAVTLNHQAVSNTLAILSSFSTPKRPGIHADSPSISSNPLNLTLQVKRTSICLFHPDSRDPSQQDHVSLASTADYWLPEIAHIRIDLDCLAFAFQKQRRDSDTAFGIDCTASGLKIRESALHGPSHQLVSIHSPQSIPDISKLYTYLDTNLCPSACGSSQPADYGVVLRAESFLHADSGPHHHVSVVMPPLRIDVTGEATKRLATYLEGNIDSFKRTVVGNETARRATVSYKLTFPFIRAVADLESPSSPLQNEDVASWKPVMDIFNMTIASAQETGCSDANNKKPLLAAGFIVLGITESDEVVEYTPLCLVEDANLSSATKNEPKNSPDGRFDGIVASMHKFYRDNIQSVEDLVTKSWSDVGDDASNAADGDLSKLWMNSSSRAKHHPFASLSLSTVVVDASNVEVFLLDAHIPALRMLLLQLKALNGNEQELTTYPSFAASVVSKAATIRLGTRRGPAEYVHSVLIGDIDMVLSLNSSNATKNTLATELVCASIRIIKRVKHQTSTKAWTESVIAQPTMTSDMAPMLRLVFSQCDDAELGIRQINVTTVFNNCTVHLPLDTTCIIDTSVLAKNSGDEDEVSANEGVELDSFIDMHGLLANLSIVHQKTPQDLHTSLTCINQLRLSTHVISGSPTLAVEVSLVDTDFNISLSREAAGCLSRTITGEVLDDPRVAFRSHIQSVGFVRIAQADIARVSLRLNSGSILPKLSAEVSINLMQVDSFSDSFRAITAYLAAIQKESFVRDSSEPKGGDLKADVVGVKLSEQNILEGIDDDAFQRPPKKGDNSGAADDEWEMNFSGAEESFSRTIGQIVRSFIPPEEFVVHNNFLATVTQNEATENDEETPLVIVILKELNLVWRLYDGSHWDYDESSLRKATPNIMSDRQSNTETIRNEYSNADTVETDTSDGFTNEYGSDEKYKQHTYKDHPNKKEHEIEVRLVKVGCRVAKYSKEQRDCIQEASLIVRDIEIIDNVKTSQWRKFFSYLKPDGSKFPRDMDSEMVSLSMNTFHQKDGQEEVRLRVSLLPFRMFIDQDTLKFLIRLGSEMLSSDKDVLPKPSSTGSAGPFFQICEVEPIVMKMDYKPKHVDFASLKDGHFIEILNFIHLEGAELSLDRTRVSGVKGWDQLMSRLLSVWLPYIKNTQVPSVASGVSSVRPLVNIGGGLANLILLPIEQFKKDGRIVKGLQKGTSAFLKATTMETIRLGSELAAGTQVILERAEDFVSNSSASSSAGKLKSVSSTGTSSQQQYSKFAEHPSDIREGLQMGYESLSNGVRNAVRTILAVPTEILESNEDGDIHPVVRAVPVAILQPIIGASDAVSKTLVGLHNMLDKTNQEKLEDKFKRSM